MVLEDWDKNVRPHLNFIADGAEMAARNARRLMVRPEWRTASQDELDDARKALEAALETIKAAQATYDAKPLEAADVQD
jgi:multidrug efflux pump subunit AcrA (membrane-fusion protein)